MATVVRSVIIIGMIGNNEGPLLRRHAHGFTGARKTNGPLVGMVTTKRTVGEIDEVEVRFYEARLPSGPRQVGGWDGNAGNGRERAV